MNQSSQNESKNTLLSWLSSISVLSLLGLIGWWGHTNHWQFQSHAKASSEAVVSEVPTDTKTEMNVEQARTAAIGTLPTISFDSPQSAKDSGIEIAQAVRGEMDEFVVANGVVDYDQTRVAQLSLRVGGSVWRVEKHLGEHVERGTQLVIVDSAAVGEAKAKLLEACVVFRLKSQHLERVSKIKDAIAGREIIELQAASELARTQRFNALQKLTNMGFTLQLSDVENLSADELSRKLHHLGLPESLRGETNSDNLIPLLASFDGVVTKCDVVRGETVEPSKPIYVIADMRKMWIQLNIRQDDASRLKLGAPVIFEGDMRTRPVTATLTWIGTEIDSRTRTVQARAEVDNPLLNEGSTEPTAARLLSAGAFGTAKILIQKLSDVVTVPDSALHWQWEVGKEVVFVAEDEGRSFKPCVVEKGLMRNGVVQIQNGLSADSRIVVHGGRVLAAELSEHLQSEVGENADAIRIFHHAHDDHIPSK